MRKFIALNATLLLLASQIALAAPQYEEYDADDYDDWGFGSRGEQQDTTDTWRWGGEEDGNSFQDILNFKETTTSTSTTTSKPAGSTFAETLFTDEEMEEVQRVEGIGARDSGSPEALSGDHGMAEEGGVAEVAAAAAGGNGGSIIAGFVLFTVLVCAAYYIVKWKRSGDQRPDFEDDYEDHELGYRDSPHSTVSSSDAKTPRGDA